jgi:putative holliday junction resolvase
VSGRILALDPGSHRIGVAVTDADGIAAHPRPSLDAADPGLFEAIGNLVRELDVGLIVVGLPTSLSGSEGTGAQGARAFAARVEAHVGVPTTLHDERYTTVIAERALLEGGLRRSKRRRLRDGVAATLLLTDYLETRR